MYDYEAIEKNLKTKYVGRVFLQFDKIESTNAKCKNISPECPKGMMVLTEEDIEENIYIKEDIKNYDRSILMSIIFKLKKEDFEKENIETLITYAGASSLIDTSVNYFNNIKYHWEKVIKGDNFLCEVDSAKSLKSNDRSIMIGFKIYYNNKIEREQFIAEISNSLEENYEKMFNNGEINKIVDLCSRYLKNKDKYILINKKNRKTVNELKDINLDNSGSLIGKDGEKKIKIKWKEYDINWCD
jgi:hypothetical protein